MESRKTHLGHSENVLICSVPFAIYGDGDDIVCMRLSDGIAVTLKQSELKLLSKMRTAKTLNEWLESLSREDLEERLTHRRHSNLARLIRWASSVADASASQGRVKVYEAMYRQFLPDIQALMTNGLLVPVEKALNDLASERDSTINKCRISTLCIPTCGRSQYLSRCISSFSDSLCAHGRNDATILIVDDSADEGQENRNFKVIDSLRTSDGPSIKFVGNKERQNLIARMLSKNAAPPEVVQFALNAEKLLTTEGSVRNTIMLLTQGQYILQSDDDTACAYVSGVQSDSVAISAVPDPYQTYFYPDRESNLRDFPTALGTDPFAIHEAVLGKFMSDVIQHSKSVKWDDTNPHDFIGNSYIDITTTGASGDPGMSSCCSFLISGPADTLKRVYASQESYQVATNIRQVLRIVPNLTICRGSIFQTMSFAINNTKLQPPFFPVGRGLDDVFSLLYFHSNTEGVIGHVPFAITHISESDRRYEGWPTSKSLTTLCEPLVPLTYFVKLCISGTQNYYGATMGCNLRAVGEQMIAMGSISRKAFVSYVREKHVEKVFQMIAQFEESIKRCEYRSKQRAGDLTVLINGFRKSVIESRAIVPSDFPSTVGIDDALAKVQSYVAMYGQLMVHWPHIVEAAGEISSSCII